MSLDFQSYLKKSIKDASRKQQSFYVSTDAVERPQLRLMAQKVPEKQRDGQPKKKVNPVPVLEGIRDFCAAHKHIVLVGRPGSGKSTALNQLLIEEATRSIENSSLLIPVLVPLKSDQPILKLIQRALWRGRLRLDETAIEDLLFEGRLLLLLDGINEIPIQELQQELQEFREDNLNVSMIFTTRDLASGGYLGIEKQLEMQPLTPSQLREFVGESFPEQTEEFLNQLSDRLKELGKTPLLLEMLCEIFRRTGKIPENLGLVFREFTQHYERNLKEGVRIESDRELWKPVLQQLAWVMMHKGEPTELRGEIERKEAIEAIGQFLNEQFPYSEARKCLRDLEKYHLIQMGTSQEELEFRHQLIQEYYAAEALSAQLEEFDLEDGKQFKQEFLNFLKWTEPVALMLALVKDQALAIQIVRLALEVDLFLGARLAGEVKLESQKETVGLVQVIEVPEWLAVKLLGKTRSPLVTPKLIELLNHQDINIAKLAAGSLGETNDSVAIEILTERLETIDVKFFSQKQFSDSDETATIWTKHIQALAYISPQQAIQFLKRKLSPNGGFSFVITAFTQAPQILMRLAAAEVLPQLLNALQQATSRTQKTEILNLVEVGEQYEKFVPDLVNILKNEKDENVQEQLAGLICKFKSDVVTQTSLWMMSHSSEKLRKKAVDFIVENKPDLTKELEDLLAKKDDNPDLAFSAAITLGSLGHEIATTFLGETLINHEFYGCRIAAARGLKGINSEESIAYLLQGLEDGNEFVKREVAFSLSTFARVEAVPILMECFNSGDRNAHINAIRGLSKLKLESFLWNILENESFGWQTAAIELAKLGRIQVVPYLRKALIDFEFSSSEETIDLLALSADCATVDWLLDALGNPSQYKTDQHFPNRVAIVLNRLPMNLAAMSLRGLLELQTNRNIEQISWLLPYTQSQCQFYSYEIYQAYLEAQKHDRQTPQNSDRSNMNSINQSSLTLFYSYAHADEILRDELDKHLKLLQRQGIITAWYDRDITAGTEWATAIDQNLNTADIILLLISANFLASDYCYDTELTRALDRHTQGEARIIPIILKPCDWEFAPFGKLQALPIAHGAGAKAVTTWNNQDEAFLAIAQGIRKVAEAFRNKKETVDRQPQQNSNPPIVYNIHQVGNLNTGSVTIQGDQIGEQP